MSQFALQEPSTLPAPRVNLKELTTKPPIGFLEKVRGLPIVKNIELFWITQIRERLVYGHTQKTFFRLFGGHILFQTLATAAHLNLFTIIKNIGPLTEDQIAEKLGIGSQPCRILLLSLVASDVLKLSRGRYSNTTLAKKFLTDDSDWKFLSCLRWQHCINYRPMFHFEAALLSGKNVGLEELPGTEPTLYQRLAHQPVLEKIFQDAMQEISALSNGFLARYVDFSPSSYLVDVGGGNGTNIITIAKQYPRLRASVFDFPSICGRAAENIANHELTDRLSTVPGNVFIDPFPIGADCIIFCHFLTIWSLEQNLQILRRAYEALPPGGRVMIFNMMQNDDRTGPITAAVGSPYFLALATGDGMLYSWKDYERIFAQAGFLKTERRTLPRDHGVIIGTK